MPGGSRSGGDGVSRDWLERHGCALDPVEDMVEAALPVQISQTAGLLETLLLRLTPHMTGCLLSVELATEKTQGVRIADLALELPFGEFRFDWLPQASRKPPRYFFPGEGIFDFPPDEVINHRIPGILHANYPWEGFLLGTAMQPLPKTLVGSVAAKLIAYSEFRLVGQEELSVAVLPIDPPKKAVRSRVSVFDREDDGASARIVRPQPLLPQPGPDATPNGDVTEPRGH